ncbi:nuclear transport factor 2 family protein [Parvularcula lutaonensis]|uniref:Nuclear transport factor 2 family protein n=1 Tax=Parvularcula lutaonensis TaxID=491923 RepID=A0ABV7M7Q0_9PROT|nr:nuclear transport factor 2 family protein [Parvularcula lutaonensis]GGY42417.1 hypothetical protein GCM10007148_08840 [Parvularcula lutaonensis]
MKYDNLEEAIRAYYRDRLRADGFLSSEWFHPSAVISLNGSGIVDAHEPLTPISGRRRSSDDPEEQQALLDTLRKSWRIHTAEIIDTLTQDDVIVLRAIWDVECLETGERATTEVCEHYRFAGDRIASVIAFFDTALAKRMISA